MPVDGAHLTDKDNLQDCRHLNNSVNVLHNCHLCQGPKGKTPTDGNLIKRVETAFKHFIFVQLCQNKKMVISILNNIKHNAYLYP